MISSNIQKIVVAVIVVILLGVFGYTVFNRSSDPSTVSTDSDAKNTGKDVLVLIEKLRVINIDQKIFSSPLLNNLKDFSVPISPEQQGRPNPFASIGSDFGIQQPVPPSGTKPASGQ